MSAVARHSLHAEAARRSQHRFTHNGRRLSILRSALHDSMGALAGPAMRAARACESSKRASTRCLAACAAPAPPRPLAVVAACSRSSRSHGRTYSPAGADAAPAPAVPHCALPAPAAASRGPLCWPRTAVGADGAARRGCMAAMALRPLLATAAEADWALAAATAAAGKAMGLASRKPGGNTRGRCSCSGHGAGSGACWHRITPAFHARVIGCSLFSCMRAAEFGTVFWGACGPPLRKLVAI